MIVTGGALGIRLVRFAEETSETVDLFCSNAGILEPGGVDVADYDWRRIWEIKALSQFHAVRAVIPGMIRSGGVFMITASAAGLLNQIGSAPYSAIKHAAVGLAENLDISYAEPGCKNLHAA